MTTWMTKAEFVAILAGLLLAMLIIGLPAFPDFKASAAAGFLLSMVMWITWQDIDDFSIPDAPMVVIALVGAAVRFMAVGDATGSEMVLIATDAALCGGALWLIREAYFRLRGIDGLGFGDVKLAAALGILLGTSGFAWSLFIASVAGLLLVAAAAVFLRKRDLDRLPFGAFLAPVGWALWMLAR